MYKGKRILGLIPARSGSKGLVRKNIRSLFGKPLIAWTIEAALKSKHLDSIAVSTDDPKIAKISKKYGAEAPFMRPKKLASDKAKSIDVILHALRFYQKDAQEFDYLILLEPTSPLREAADIDKSIELLVNNTQGAVSIVGVSEVIAAHPAFDVIINDKGLLIPYERNFAKAGRRQDLSKLYFLEGSIYISQVSELFKRRTFFHKRTLGYIVPKWKSLEVDDFMDLVCIEAIMKNLKKIKRT